MTINFLYDTLQNYTRLADVGFTAAQAQQLTDMFEELAIEIHKLEHKIEILKEYKSWAIQSGRQQ